MNKEFKNINPFKYYKIKKIFKLKKLPCYDPTWLIKDPPGLSTLTISFKAFSGEGVCSIHSEENRNENVLLGKVIEQESSLDHEQENFLDTDFANFADISLTISLLHLLWIPSVILPVPQPTSNTLV